MGCESGEDTKTHSFSWKEIIFSRDLLNVIRGKYVCKHTKADSWIEEGTNAIIYLFASIIMASTGLLVELSSILCLIIFGVQCKKSKLRKNTCALCETAINIKIL